MPRINVALVKPLSSGELLNFLYCCRIWLQQCFIWFYYVYAALLYNSGSTTTCANAFVYRHCALDLSFVPLDTGCFCVYSLICETVASDHQSCNQACSLNGDTLR